MTAATAAAAADADDVPVPNVVDDRNDVYVFKNYFIKHMCENEQDNFYEDGVFSNDEFRTHARTIYNEETKKDFLEKIYDQDANYQKMIRGVIDSLVNRGLLRREEMADRATNEYWKTDLLKELCPEVRRAQSPDIDAILDKHNKEHSES